MVLNVEQIIVGVDAAAKVLNTFYSNMLVNLK